MKITKKEIATSTRTVEIGTVRHAFDDISGLYFASQAGRVYLTYEFMPVPETIRVGTACTKKEFISVVHEYLTNDD